MARNLQPTTVPIPATIAPCRGLPAVWFRRKVTSALRVSSPERWATSSIKTWLVTCHQLSLMTLRRRRRIARTAGTMTGAGAIVAIARALRVNGIYPNFRVEVLECQRKPCWPHPCLTHTSGVYLDDSFLFLIESAALIPLSFDLWFCPLPLEFWPS